MSMPADASPSDKANDTIIKFRKRRVKNYDVLYDELCRAGLSSEEASDMCKLEEESGE